MDLRKNPFFLDDKGIAWVKQTLDSLSLEEKIGQLFCVLYKEGTEAEINHVERILMPGAAAYRAMPLHNAVCLTNELNRRSKTPLLIAANLEKGGNGIVNEGTLMGSPMEIAATNNVSMAERLAIVCGREAAVVGANWSFAPIVDIDSNCYNPITNTRTFGSDPQQVMKMSAAYVKAIQNLGVAACIKHFPGDGQDERDQHLVTSINDMSCKKWDETYGLVYDCCIRAGALSCMIGHIMQPAYTRLLNPKIEDKNILPASLSKELVTDLLRNKLGFNGVIVTDATTMAGYTIPMSRHAAVPTSIAAGCDMFLFARNLEEDYMYMTQGVQSGIITQERLNEAVTRILAMKASLGLHKERRMASVEKAMEIVGCSEHLEWAKECADKSITLVKSESGVLPLTIAKYKRILFYEIESPGGTSQYKVAEGACREVYYALVNEGFVVDLFVSDVESEGKTQSTSSVISKYDLIIYVANLTTKSNQTVVRIEWAQPMGANCPHYINDVPTLFISLENPYHLLDVPRIRTYINTYSSNKMSIKLLIEKLLGRSEFVGASPIDPFCGKWDAML